MIYLIKMITYHKTLSYINIMSGRKQGNQKKEPASGAGADDVKDIMLPYVLT